MKLLIRTSVFSMYRLVTNGVIPRLCVETVLGFTADPARQVNNIDPMISDPLKHIREDMNALILGLPADVQGEDILPHLKAEMPTYEGMDRFIGIKTVGTSEGGGPCYIIGKVRTPL